MSHQQSDEQKPQRQMQADQPEEAPLARPNSPPNPVYGQGDAGFWGDDDPKYGPWPEKNDPVGL